MFRQSEGLDRLLAGAVSSTLTGLEEAIVIDSRFFAEGEAPEPDNWARDVRTQATYQIVGAMAHALGIFDRPDVARILDLLAYGRTKDGQSVLPFDAVAQRSKI